MFFLALCYFVLFSPFSIAITSLGEELGSLGAFRTFARFALVWFCLFTLPLGVWEGLPGLFSFPFFCDCGIPWTFLLPFLEHVKCAAICICKELDLDVYVATRCVPDQSWTNQAERVMAFFIWILRYFQEYFTYTEPIVHQRWAKTGEPGEKRLKIRTQNFAFPHMTRARLEPQR